MSTQQVPERVRTRAAGLAVVGTALHALFGLALFAGYAWYVPAAKRTFDQFGLRVGWLTADVVRVADWVADWRGQLVPLLGLFGALDFALIWLLARRGPFAAPLLWLVGVALLLVGAGALTTYAIEVPMAKLREGLAK